MLSFLEVPAYGTVFNQGDRGDLFYILLAGSVTISVHDAARDSHTVVAELKTSGESFGELALCVSRCL